MDNGLKGHGQRYGKTVIGVSILVIMDNGLKVGKIKETI